MNFKQITEALNYKIYIVISLIFIILILFFVTRKNYPENLKIEKYYNCDQLHHATVPIQSAEILNDKNDIQLLHAQKNGLKVPFATNVQLELGVKKYLDYGMLVKVTDNGFYHVKKLTHSHPYLIPETVEMLNDIAYRFRKRLKEKKLNNYAIVLTSLMRTDETQERLSHRNRNATGHSAHIYGTTVDISYKNFYNLDADSLESSWEGIQELTKTLVEMRKECKLLAVRERKQSCFHITVVVCDGMSNKLAVKNEDN
ncbi:MAG TPA: DUF5715 family protein [Paludibacter sp.]|nr:DUF5715 family protein [Paludibacter sp.]